MVQQVPRRCSFVPRESALLIKEIPFLVVLMRDTGPLG